MGLLLLVFSIDSACFFILLSSEIFNFHFWKRYMCTVCICLKSIETIILKQKFSSIFSQPWCYSLILRVCICILLKSIETVILKQKFSSMFSCYWFSIDSACLFIFAVFARFWIFIWAVLRMHASASFEKHWNCHFETKVFKYILSPLMFFIDSAGLFISAVFVQFEFSSVAVLRMYLFIFRLLCCYEPLQICEFLMCFCVVVDIVLPSNCVILLDSWLHDTISFMLAVTNMDFCYIINLMSTHHLFDFGLFFIAGVMRWIETFSRHWNSWLLWTDVLILWWLPILCCKSLQHFMCLQCLLCVHAVDRYSM